MSLPRPPSCAFAALQANEAAVLEVKRESFSRRTFGWSCRLRNMNRGLSLLDSIQEGNIGLMKAVD